jgi:3-hydroxyacyl-CoA dehydrogenase
MLNDKIKLVSVIGAGGKMGSGIALLLLQEMARLEAETTGKVGSSTFKLALIDSSEQALIHMHKSLRGHLTKYAEQNINNLRRYLRSNPLLVSNEEIIGYYVDGALEIVRLDTQLEAAHQSTLVFEAIVEDVKVKGDLFKSLSVVADKEAYYFTNTSSIPIEILNAEGKLNNRLIGFHFYNPPAIQKLLEIIPPADVNPELFKLSEELAKRLKKTVVISKDVAGFIGNGYFMREMLFAFEKVQELSRTHSLPQAFYLVNKVTRDFLIRPMGMFQLIDYVGIDVCRRICSIMGLKSALLDSPDLDKNRVLDEKGVLECDQELGPLPKGYVPWKSLQRDPDKDAKLQAYFTNLRSDSSFGAALGKEFLQKMANIANGLVKSGVAASLEDVDIVLQNGFFHLYGPSLFDARKQSCAV